MLGIAHRLPHEEASALSGSRRLTCFVTDHSFLDVPVFPARIAFDVRKLIDASSTEVLREADLSSRVDLPRLASASTLLFNVPTLSLREKLSSIGLSINGGCMSHFCGPPVLIGHGIFVFLVDQLHLGPMARLISCRLIVNLRWTTSSLKTCPYAHAIPSRILGAASEPNRDGMTASSRSWKR